jgi:hypothetical protein
MTGSCLHGPPPGGARRGFIRSGSAPLAVPHYCPDVSRFVSLSWIDNFVFDLEIDLSEFSYCRDGSDVFQLLNCEGQTIKLIPF